jgi:uncharacterized membrane protein YfcA
MRAFTLACLVAAGLFIAVSAYALDVHPTRAVLWVALAVVSLIGAWLSARAAHHESERDHRNAARR